MTENQNPEQQARDNIDEQLRQAGWTVQSRNKMDLNAGIGQAVREYQTDAGVADYALFVAKKAVGIVEAKKKEMGQNITTVEDQTGSYAGARLKWVNNNKPLPFLYESTGIITRFTDGRDPKPRSREVFNFHRPETLKEWIEQGPSLRERLHHIPPLNPFKLSALALHLRDCQETAITNLEASFMADYPRALIQMATGAGKTYTAITSIYRLLKYAGAKRILFLVDTKNLGEQAEQEMMSYVPLDDNRKFTELYNVQRLKSSYVAKDSQVCICTIQRLYSILKGNPLDESAEDLNPAEWVHPRESGGEAVIPAQAGIHANERLDSRLRGNDERGGGNDEPLETSTALLARIQTEREQRYQQQLQQWQTSGGSKPKAPKSLPPLTAAELAAVPELPEGWGWVKLGEFIEAIEAGKSFKCDEREPNSDEIGVAKVSAVTWGEYDESESKTCIDAAKENDDYLIQNGDFILSRANTIDLVGACVIARKVTKKIMLSDKTLRIKFDGFSKEYFLQFLRSRFGRKQIMQLSTGNQESMRNIGQDRIRSIVVPVCSNEEAGAVMEILASKLSEVDQLDQTITASLQQAEALRQSILKKAFSGQLVAQDANDEPAAALLARIRAEREKSPPLPKGGGHAKFQLVTNCHRLKFPCIYEQGVLTMQPQPAIFEEHEIRRVYDEATETWLFSVIDIVRVLTQASDYQTARKYWKVLKGRLDKEGSQLVTNCYQLKMAAEDGKQRLTDVATAETLLRLVQSVPSPKAEPIKLWLAKVGYERMQEMADPALSLERARETWQKHGRSEKWIQQRMTGQETRNKLTDYWKEHDIKEGEEYAILTNIIHQEWTGVDVKAHKTMKGLKSQNLRDHMSEAELIFTALAELSTRQIAESVDATGMTENEAAAKTGGGIAKKARLELEGKTGKRVVSAENYLPPDKKLTKD